MNTWMGDPIRVMMLRAVAEEVKTKNLLAQCQESGDVLLAGLRDLEVGLTLTVSFIYIDVTSPPC